jgi:hypothetical protein
MSNFTNMKTRFQNLFYLKKTLKEEIYVWI